MYIFKTKIPAILKSAYKYNKIQVYHILSEFGYTLEVDLNINQILKSNSFKEFISSRTDEDSQLLLKKLSAVNSFTVNLVDALSKNIK